MITERWKNKISHSLKTEMLAGVALSLALGIAAFLALWIAGGLVCANLIEPARQTRSIQEAAGSFQTFVTANSVASTDWGAISAWQQTQDDVLVLNGGADIGEGKGLGGGRGNPEGRGRGEGKGAEKHERAQASVSITYTDGTADTVFTALPDRSGVIIVLAIAILIGFAVFFAVFYRMVNRKMKNLLEIGNGVSILEGGDLSYRITPRGQDELARLAHSINDMSDSFTERMLSEQQAVKSGREIIGDLSHDIRTPLTILSGYIPLLLEGEPLTETQRDYLNRMQEKTGEMKRRVEELLNYATVFSARQKVKKVRLKGGMILSQLADEISLVAGAAVMGDIPDDAEFLGDPALLSRLFDNLISNIHQHGDLAKPVKVSGTLMGGWLHFEIENAVKEGGGSTGKSLGLKISRFIAEAHGGTIESTEQGGVFKTVLEIPSASREG